MGELTPTVPASRAAPWKEALHSGRCPVCFLLRQDEFEELRRWVGSGVDDPQNRHRLDEAGGFCNAHFWLLRELHSPQSGSRVNEYLATRLLDWLRDPDRQDWSAQSVWLRQATALCPLCVRLDACETAHVRAFVAWLSESVAWSEYAESRGLCVPHLLRCQSVIQDPALRQHLHQAQAAQIERLQHEMRELVRKLAAGRRWDASRDEWLAWERATEKFVGRSGLFPLRTDARPQVTSAGDR